MVCCRLQRGGAGEGARGARGGLGLREVHHAVVRVPGVVLCVRALGVEEVNGLEHDRGEHVGEGEKLVGGDRENERKVHGEKRSANETRECSV